MAVLALLGTAVFAQVAAAKGPFTPNTSGDVRAVFHSGNIQPGAIGHVPGACPTGELTIPGATVGDTFITIPPQPAGSSFIVYVKGGPQYNTYSYPPLDPTSAGALMNLHAPVNNGGNIVGISHWFICGSVAPQLTTLNVSFGYADAGPFGHAFPAQPLLTDFGGIWGGAALADHVNFLGSSASCSLSRCGFDSGAVRIDNPTASDITVSNVYVTIGAFTFNPWGSGSLTIPANGHLVLAQTADWNFDTSDIAAPPTCTTALIPVLHATTTGAEQTVNDNAQTLVQHGADPLECDTTIVENETLPWALAGSIHS